MIDNLFLCVGAQKAGTTWLHAQLEHHKEISFSDVKEVHYFNTIHNNSILLSRRKVDHLERILKNNRSALERYFTDISAGNSVDNGIKRLMSPVDDQWYIDLFKNKNGKYAADFSPEYALLGDDGFEHIKKISEHQKIIFMMRDPVQRALSAIKYYFKMKNVDINNVPYEEILCLAKSELIINMSSYDRTIKSLKHVFDDEDVLYLFYEEVMQNKQNAIDDVSDFLKINKVVIPQEKLDQKINITEKFDIPQDIVDELSTSLMHVYSYVSRVFYKPNGWRF